ACQVYRLPGVGPDVRFFIGFSGVLCASSSPLEKGRFPGTSRIGSAAPRRGGGPARESSMTQHETFLDLLALILKRRRFLFWNSLIVTVAVLVISFFLPTRYKATASILFPPENGQSLAGLSSLMQQFDISKHLLG